MTRTQGSAAAGALPTEPRAGRRSWSGLSVASKRLIAVGAALMLTMVVAVSLTLWNMRQVALVDARQNVGKLGIAIAEQTTRSVQAMDLALQDLRKDIMALGVDTPEKFRTLLQTRAEHLQLLQRGAALPQADAFALIDSDGQLVNFSRRWPIPSLNLSDRDYVRHFREHDDAGVFVSAAVQVRDSRTWTVYVVRRVTAPSGAFIGLVVGAIDLNYFREFYRALTVGADTTVTLLRSEGVVLTSYPTIAQTGARLPPTSRWHQTVARHRPESLVTERLITNVPSVVSVHPLPDYPLVVDVSVSVRDALATWRRTAWLAFAGTGTAVLCVILLLRALSLQLQRLERSEASLAEQNRRLEAAQRRLESQTTELQASRQRLAEKSDALETTLGHMNQGIMMIGPDRNVAVCNERAMQMLDLPASLMERRPSFDEVVEYQRSMQEFSDQDTPPWAGVANLLLSPLTYERKRPNGRILEFESVPLGNGGLVRTYTDITDRRVSEERVRYFAHHDDLTKLVNRVVFQQRLQHAIELADCRRRSIAVLYLDLDRFKHVNDTRGHAVGDKLLVQVADRLRTAVRDVDTVARMGGDEFAIIQPLIERPNSSARLAQRVLELIREPFYIDGSLCSVGVSIGISHYPDHATTASDLLRNADTALYRAKADGRGAYRIFEQDMDARQQQLCMLEQELRLALDGRQFELEYQPIVDAGSGRIVCCEALLRWRHPTQGLIGPGEFIGLAEKSGLIVPIGLWVLETACAEAVRWPSEVAVAVNLSPAQFNHASLIEDLVAITARTGLPPSRLVLEITEGLLLEESRIVLDTMSQLRELGVRFSLDDFGTAHAGLSYLRRFPFDTIKIDKSFVQDAVDQPEARAIVSAILGLANALKLAVIAEGVEQEPQMDQMRRMGCPYVQGFLISPPVSPASVARLMQIRSALAEPRQPAE
ncbi:MAG: EAL domain-containing protein [Acetobacteraceae bacterium]